MQKHLLILFATSVATSIALQKRHPAKPAVKVGTKWAVLVAGSNEYYNYRHQVDVSHAYQILHKKGGFPHENIITLMYDDIAFNSQNPFQGNLINHPNGTNVYTFGCDHCPDTIDYTGDDVNAENFLRVLNGTAHGRSLKNATQHDEVFVYFSDHGAQGLVAMPVGDPLYADQLKSTLEGMVRAKQFRQMVIYIEACESGSMFAEPNHLPSMWNIYATTASDADSSSYACYWDETRQVYLGDVYSVNWMEDTEQFEAQGETLEEQWERVAKKTNTSSVLQFGNKKIADQPDTDFMEFATRFTHYKRLLKKAAPKSYTGPTVSSRDVVLSTLQMRLKSETSPARRAELESRIQGEIYVRGRWDLYFDTLSKMALEARGVPLSKRRFEQDWLIRGQTPPRNFACLREAFAATESCLGRFNDYSLQYVRTLVNLCEASDRQALREMHSRTCRSIRIARIASAESP